MRVLLFLMVRQLTGDSAHEWLGAGMLILWIAHHMLLVTDENEIYLTEGIKNDFTLNENFSDMEIHVITK